MLIQNLITPVICAYRWKIAPGQGRVGLPLRNYDCSLPAHNQPLRPQVVFFSCIVISAMACRGYGRRTGHEPGTERRRAPGATGLRTALRKFRTGMITNQPDDGSKETEAIRQPTTDYKLLSIRNKLRRGGITCFKAKHVTFLLLWHLCTLCQVPINAFLRF